jgi:endonuclease/exonuclease/phosphatase family metal-dependent hydrolase
MEKTLRVVSFNINGARSPGRRSKLAQQRSWHQLAAFDADVALIQEAEHKAIPPWARERWEIIPVSADLIQNTAGWGSLIAAVPSLKPSTLQWGEASPLIDLIYDYAVFGEIDLPDGTRSIVSSVHAPASKLPKYLEIMGKQGSLTKTQMHAMAQPGDDPWALDLLFHAIVPLVRRKRFIVGGDWNNSRLFDMNSSLRKRGQLPFGSMFFTRARDEGWHDCHGHKNEERSFLREGTLPHQLDHVFCDKKTRARLVDSSVSSGWLAYELSDHAPVIVDFNWD